MKNITKFFVVTLSVVFCVAVGKMIIDNKEQLKIGALLLYVSKTYSLDEESGQYIATALKLFLDNISIPKYNNFIINPEICLVFDVCRGEFYNAPRSFAKRKNDLKHACEEIASRWDIIE